MRRECVWEERMETPTRRKHSPVVGITVKGTGLRDVTVRPHEMGAPGVGWGNAALRGEATATVRVSVWGSFQSFAGST